MRIGVFTALLQDLPLERALDYVKDAGLDTVEIGTGNFPGDAHCKPAELLGDEGKLKAFRRAFESRGMTISALSCHGNPLHADRAYARACHEVQRNTVLLAERLGVRCVNLFAGCPGSSDDDTHANWVTCPWPPEFSEILAWQWNEKLIPYWREEAAFAKEHGDVKYCFEMHPGVAVYNPETLLRLREAAGEAIGANFDPSHLYWQGIDPILAVRAIGRAGALFHVHAKDTGIDAANVAVNGVLDTKSYKRLPERSWIFRSVGWGHDVLHWKQLVSELRVNGYDYVLSIEHEDALASDVEGLRSAVTTLKQCLLTEPPAEAYWA
jgi:sugar phosphate isomerase/epimerase